MWFSPQMGVVYCDECKKAASSVLKLRSGVFNAMRHIIYSDFGKLFSFKLSEESTNELSKISRAYLLAQVERMLPALNYYESIFPDQ